MFRSYCKCTNKNLLNETPLANCSRMCSDNTNYSCGDNNSGYSVYKSK